MLWTMPRYKQVQAGAGPGALRHPGEPHRRAGGACLRQGGGRDPAVRGGEPGPHPSPGVRGPRLRVDEPGHLCAHQPGHRGAHLGRGPAGGHRRPHPGRGSGPLKLHVPDFGGAHQAGQPDSEHHQSPGLRQPGGRGDGGKAQPHRARGREGQGGRGPGRAVRGGGPHLPGGPAAPPCPASALPPGRDRPWGSLAVRAAARLPW